MTLYEQYKIKRKMKIYGKELYMQLVELTKAKHCTKLLVANDRKYYIMFDSKSFVATSPIDNISHKLLANKPEDVVHMFQYDREYAWTHETRFHVINETTLSPRNEELYMQLVELIKAKPCTKLLVANDRKYYIMFDSKSFVATAPIDNISRKFLANKPEDVVHMFQYDREYAWTHETRFHVINETLSPRNLDYSMAKKTGVNATLYAFTKTIYGRYYEADINEDSLPLGLCMFYMVKNPNIFAREAIPFIAIAKDKPENFAGVFITENGHGYEWLIFGHDRTTEFTDDSMYNFVLD